jgi:hypothetical protein
MNKRQFERKSLEESIELVIEEIRGNGFIHNNVSIYIDEVSLEGIRFVTDIDMEVDQCISFDLPTFNNYSLIRGRIVWKKEFEGHRFHYGLQIFNE